MKDIFVSAAWRSGSMSVEKCVEMVTTYGNPTLGTQLFMKRKSGKELSEGEATANMERIKSIFRLLNNASPTKEPSDPKWEELL